MTTSPSFTQPTKLTPSCLHCPWNKRYFRNNAPYTIFMLIYVLINIVLFIVSAVRYRTSNWCVIIARGCGMCLNFNSAFIAVPMLRYSLTWVRRTKMASLLPLDHAVYIHKVVAIVIVVESAIHTLAHLGNLGKSCLKINQTNVTTIKQKAANPWSVLYHVRETTKQNKAKTKKSIKTLGKLGQGNSLWVKICLILLRGLIKLQLESIE